jgi:hypothetical protein
MVEDRDLKHKAWAKLTGDDHGKRSMKQCADCGDRVSICHHAQKAQDDARIYAIGLQQRLEAKEQLVTQLEREAAAPSQERLLLLYLEKCVRELYVQPKEGEPPPNPWPSISVTLADLERSRK